MSANQICVRRDIKSMDTTCTDRAATPSPSASHSACLLQRVMSLAGLLGRFGRWRAVGRAQLARAIAETE